MNNSVEASPGSTGCFHGNFAPSIIDCCQPKHQKCGPRLRCTADIKQRSWCSIEAEVNWLATSNVINPTNSLCSHMSETFIKRAWKSVLDSLGPDMQFAATHRHNTKCKQSRKSTHLFCRHPMHASYGATAKQRHEDMLVCRQAESSTCCQESAKRRQNSSLTRMLTWPSQQLQHP